MKKAYIETIFPIGSKIILVGNEPSDHPNGFDHLAIGYVYEHYEKNNNYFVSYTKNPINEVDSDTPVYITFSDPLPYSEELYKALSKLNWDERWNIYNKGIIILTKEDKHRKAFFRLGKAKEFWEKEGKEWIH